MDSEITRKQVAYDLTLEYIRQSKIVNNCYSEIPNKVEEIDKIYNSFYDALKNKDITKR